MNNWLSRLSDKLEKLSVLEDDDCTYKEAVAAWEEFFKHDFWTELTETLSVKGNQETIQAIYDKYC